MEELPPGFLSLALPTPPPPPPPPSPALLPDEIFEEFFLRMPPDDPARLLRAALVCKRWARLLADRGFRRRYRERHAAVRGRPPLLGFLANLDAAGDSARFFPTLSFSPARTSHGDYRAHDARHGRVLLDRINRGGGSEAADEAFAVWDPATDEIRALPPLPRPRHACGWNAAVLCAAHLTNCDHLDCRCGPGPGHFLVISVGVDTEEMFAQVYSSESAAWDKGISDVLPDVPPFNENLPGVLARNALYFEFMTGNMMLKYDLATRRLSLLSLPRTNLRSLMAMEDGGLGFAEVDKQFNLKLWSMATDGPGPEGDAGNWAVHRAIDLSTGLPAAALEVTPIVAAVADGAGVVFLRTTDGLYTFDVKTGQSTYVDIDEFYGLIPYVSFYTPVLRVATTGEGPSTGTSIGLQT